MPDPINPSGLQNYQFDIADGGFKPTYFTPEFFNDNQQLFSNWGYNTSNYDWFGKNGILPTSFMGLQALAGGLNAWNGMNMVNLARKQLGFARNVANANLNNSVENYYNAIKNANRVGYALQGGYARKAYGANNQELAATKAADEATKNLTRHV